MHGLRSERVSLHSQLLLKDESKSFSKVTRINISANQLDPNIDGKIKEVGCDS